MRRAALRPPPSSSGATLIELFVALALLAFGLLPLLLALNNVHVNTVKMGNRAEAQRLAAERIDALKALGFKAVETDLLAGAATVTLDEGALDIKQYRRITVLQHQKAVTSATFVDAAVGDLPTDYIRITATVEWETDSGASGRTISALMTRDGALE